MIKPLPTVREFVDAARRACHDSLGVAYDPEALIHVANVSRRAFLDDKDVMALRDWSATVEDIANIDAVEPEIQHWLAVERVRLAAAHRLVANLLASSVQPLVERLAHYEAIDDEYRAQISSGVEAAWLTPRLTREEAPEPG